MHKFGKIGIAFLAVISALQVHGQEATVQVAPQPKTLLENNAVVPVPKLENDFYDWYDRHELVKSLIKKQPVDLIFIGDSITHMFGGLPKSRIARGAETWDKYYRHRNAINMGFGWDRTQNVLWRLANGELDGISPKVAVILIGTNNRTGTKNARQNSPTEIFAGARCICEAIHTKVPQCKILLLGVLPRSPEYFVEPIREINELLATLDKHDHITFLDMWEQFADQTGLPKKELMQDTVHPNAAGYQVWAETMELVLSELLEDSTVTPD